MRVEPYFAGDGVPVETAQAPVQISAVDATETHDGVAEGLLEAIRTTRKRSAELAMKVVTDSVEELGMPPPTSWETAGKPRPSEAKRSKLRTDPECHGAHSPT